MQRCAKRKYQCQIVSVRRAFIIIHTLLLAIEQRYRSRKSPERFSEIARPPSSAISFPILLTIFWRSSTDLPSCAIVQHFSFPLYFGCALRFFLLLFLSLFLSLSFRSKLIKKPRLATTTTSRANYIYHRCAISVASRKLEDNVGSSSFSAARRDSIGIIGFIMDQESP